MQIDVVVPIEPEYLARELSDQLSYDELLDFIEALDLFVGDWAFTEMVYKWAKEQHKLFKEERKEFTFG